MFKLKKCPHCGGSGRVKFDGSEGIYVISVECTVCGAESKKYTADTEGMTAAEARDERADAAFMAYRAWNLRADPGKDGDDDRSSKGSAQSVPERMEKEESGEGKGVYGTLLGEESQSSSGGKCR